MHASLRYRHRLRGFTLVELLVVIGIIALLVAILLPSLTRARAQALSLTCASQVRQIGLAFRMYSQDNRDWLPPVRGISGVFWTTRIHPYLGPLDPNTQQIGQLYMRCPARTEEGNYTYGINYYTCAGNEGSPHYDPTYIRPTRKLSRLRNGTYVLSDAEGFYPWTLWPNGLDWPLVEDINRDGVADSATLFQAGVSAYPYNGLAFPHPKERANFLFTDGSVTSKTIKQWSTNEDGMWGDRP